MSDLTVQILTQIRDEISSLRSDVTQRIDQTNVELSTLRGDVNIRLDNVNVRLERVEQGLVDLGKFTGRLSLDLTRYESWHRHHVERLEDQVSDLNIRVDRLERR